MSIYCIVVYMIIEYIQRIIDIHPQLAALYLILAKIIGAILFFPGTPFTLLAGATFGVLWGSIISLIGNTIGAVAAFLIARYFLRGYVKNTLYTKYPKIKIYEQRFLQHGFATVLLLRLIPLFPFNALNYILGVTSVSTKDYILGTAIGIIPGTIAFVYFGRALVMVSMFHIVFSVVAIIGLVYIGKHYEKKISQQ